MSELRGHAPPRRLGHLRADYPHHRCGELRPAAGGRAHYLASRHRGDLLVKFGRYVEARAEFKLAASMTRNERGARVVRHANRQEHLSAPSSTETAGSGPAPFGGKKSQPTRKSPPSTGNLMSRCWTMKFLFPGGVDEFHWWIGVIVFRRHVADLGLWGRYQSQALHRNCLCLLDRTACTTIFDIRARQFERPPVVVAAASIELRSVVREASRCLPRFSSKPERAASSCLSPLFEPSLRNQHIGKSAHGPPDRGSKALAGVTLPRRRVGSWLAWISARCTRAFT